MQLQARRQRQRESSRTTRRVAWKQRGGDPWTTITIDTVRQSEWSSAIAASPFGGIFTEIFKTDATPARLEQWLNSIMYQDGLFEIAAELYKKNPTTEYFKDVARLVNLRYEPTSAKSKLNLLADVDPRTDESGLTADTLTFFSNAFQNSFLIGLARIINMIKKEPSQLDISLDALARYFTSYSRSNAWMSTGYDLKDGFFLDQAQAEFKAMFGVKNEFYMNMVTTLKAIKDGDIGTYLTAQLTAKNSGAVKEWSKQIWPILAAVIAALHFKGEARKILSLIRGAERMEDDAILFGAFQSFPDKAILEQPLNGLNLYSIVKNLVIGKTTGGGHVPGDSILQFIVQLTTLVVQEEAPDTFTPVTATAFFTAA